MLEMGNITQNNNHDKLEYKKNIRKIYNSTNYYYK